MNKKLFLFTVLICLLISSALDAQITNLTNASTIAPEFVGWDGAALTTSKNLDVKNNFANRNINFFTNGTAINGSSVQRMTILGNTGATAGYVGIRTASPIFPLDVRADGANNVTASGWKAGIHLSNHAALAWDNDGLG